jgi:tRNA A37 threonylcarbamoyladenosine dehydratase
MPSSPLFHRTELLLGPAVMARLAATRVILFGVGGVGSWTAEALVRTGVGHLAFVDSDVICATNVNRQLMATPAAVGRLKVEELEARLRAIHPGADLLPVPRVYHLETKNDFGLETYDYVLDAIDSLSNKLGLLIQCLELGVPVFSAMGAACKLDAAAVRVASIWKTERCPLARRIRKRLRHHQVTGDFLCVYSEEVVPNHPVAPTCGTDRCFCPRRVVGPDDAAGEAHAWCSQKAVINGSLVHVTATFGMVLAGLVIQDVVRQVGPPPSAQAEREEHAQQDPESEDDAQPDP